MPWFAFPSDCVDWPRWVHPRTGLYLTLGASVILEAHRSLAVLSLMMISAFRACPYRLDVLPEWSLFHRWIWSQGQTFKDYPPRWWVALLMFWISGVNRVVYKYPFLCVPFKYITMIPLPQPPLTLSYTAPTIANGVMLLLGQVIFLPINIIEIIHLTTFS